MTRSKAQASRSGGWAKASHGLTVDDSTFHLCREMPETALNTVGKRLDWARREMIWREGRELSPAALSYLIFLPEPTVSQWEKEIGEPSPEEIALLAHILGVDPQWLATGKYD